MNPTAAIDQQAGAQPYPGIRPFEEDEEYLFFGREAQVDAMVDTLARGRFLAVIGSSGCGKSSLVNCGLRPALHRGLLASAGSAWRMARCRPGADPMQALAEALAPALAKPAGADLPSVPAGPFSPAELIGATLSMSRLGLVEAWRQAGLPPGTNLLLVVDQFEELFRYRAVVGRSPTEAAAGGDEFDADPATAFVNLLLEARAQPLPIYIVLTMRSDFLGDCARFAGLPEAINGGQYLVPRMSRDERRQAIVGPARVFGAEIAPTLVTRLVNDVGDDPDQLSLLQHALARTWAHWRAHPAESASTASRLVDAAHYEAIGTLARALNQHAEEIFSGLDVQAQALAARAFRALTDKSTDSRGIRRPTRFGDLCAIADGSPEALAAALAPFRAAGAAFLMPPDAETLSDDSVVDLAHESLMRLWERLRDWGEREAESARMLRRLGDAADLNAAGEASLWRDPELQFALDWRERVKPTAAWARQYGRELGPALAFLEASRSARDAAAARETERLEAERRGASERRRQARTLRVTLIAVAAATVAAGALGTLWVRAESAGAVAVSRQLAAQSGTELAAGNLNRALGLAASAWRRQPSFEARDSLLAALAEAPSHWLRAGQQGVLALVHSPDGRLLASGGVDGSVKLWDAASGAALATLQGHHDRVLGIAFSPDGARLASCSADGSVMLWDVASRKAVGPPRTEHLGAVLAVAYSAEGLLASAGADERILLRDGLTGAVRGAPLLGHGDAVTGLAFSPDGRRLASTSYDGSLLLWMVDGDDSPLLRVNHTAGLREVVFSPNGKLLATASADRHVEIWDAATLMESGEPLGGHDAPVRAIAFSPDSGSIVSASEDRQVLLWDLSRRDIVGRVLTRHAGIATSVSFSPDGRQVATGGAGDVLIVHDVNPRGAYVGRLHGARGVNWALAWSPDGRTLASSDGAARIHLHDADGDGLVVGEPAEGRLAGSSALVTGLVWSPDGRLLASAGQDGRVLLWPQVTATDPGTTPRVLQEGGAPIRRARFSPNGELLGAAGQDGLIHLWNVASGDELPSGARQAGAVADIAFSPDGRQLLSAGMDGELRLWDRAGAGGNLVERQRLSLPAAGAIYRVSFRPDGRQVALATQKQGVLLWVPGQAEVQVLGKRPLPVLELAYSPDGALLASADRDGALRLWDLAAGQPLHVSLLQHHGPVLALAWSPDGRTLASAGWDQGVMLSRTDAQTWTELACKLVRLNPPEEPVAACPSGR